MIKLSDGELRDYLPSTMKNDVDMVCLSYAIKKATERLLEYQKSSMIYHFIDSLPEQILDVLAVELRSPYYTDSLDIEVKRNIVKNTLRWHTKAGTPSAVNEMIEVIFGEGEIVEWPDFNEPPYTSGTFDIVTNARLTPDILDYFVSVIDRVKNVRSHLRRILIKREWLLQEYAASNAVTNPKIPVTNNMVARENRIRMQEFTGTVMVTSPYEGITNNATPRDAGISMQECASAGTVSMPHETVTNNKEPRASSLLALESAGALTYAVPKETVTNTMRERHMKTKDAVAYFGAVVSATVATAIGNTKANEQSAAHVYKIAAISAFSVPTIVITNSKKEAAIWLNCKAQGAAAGTFYPKIII